MRVTFGGDWTAAVAGDPLDIVPRFDFRSFCVRIATYADVTERDRFQSDTFGTRSGTSVRRRPPSCAAPPGTPC